MKVLQINSVCGYGSTGRIATDIYKVLEEHGHECLIAYGRGEAPEDIRKIKIGNKLDNYVHVAETRFLDKHGFASTKATKAFIEKVKEYDPDVIHLHNIHGYYINIEIFFNYLKEANKRIIWTLHDCWSFTGHCAYFDYVGCDKWKNGCNNCPQKKSYPQSVVVDNSKWNYEMKKNLFTGVRDMTIVTPSKWLAGLVKQSFLKEYDIRVINNGIDLNVFYQRDRKIFREKYNLEDKFLILGVASVWEHRKGLEYFVELSKIIDDDIRIVLVGINDKQLKSMPENIIGIRRTKNLDELAEIYSAADVFLNPTLEDNFPTTNLEALACGIPVITFNTGGSPESIDDSCGIIVEKDQYKSIPIIIRESSIIQNSASKCINKSKVFDKRNKFLSYKELYELSQCK